MIGSCHESRLADAELTEEWNFETDKLPRADAGTEFQLYVKWKEAPVEEPEEPDNPNNPEKPDDSDNQGAIVDDNNDKPSDDGTKQDSTSDSADKSESKNDESVKTGDDTSIAMMVAILLASVAGLVAIRRKQ